MKAYSPVNEEYKTIERTFLRALDEKSILTQGSLNRLAICIQDIIRKWNMSSIYHTYHVHYVVCVVTGP